MYKVEVIADSSGKYCGNGLTFDTVDKAQTYAENLMLRWSAVRSWRVIDGNGNVPVEWEY